MTWREFQDRFLSWVMGLMMATMIGIMQSMNSKLDAALIRQAVADQKQEYYSKEVDNIKTTVEQHKMDIRDLQNAVKPIKPIVQNRK